MRLSTAILERRTFRTYEDQQVPDEQVQRILLAGHWAPSPRNLQPWRFIVIRNKDTRAELETIAREAKAISATWVPMFRPAGLRHYIQDFAHTPVSIAVTSDPEGRGRHVGDREGHLLAASMAIQNMKLMVHALGLGAVLYTHWVEEKVKVLLNMPRLWPLVGVLCVGHPIPVWTTERRSALKRRPLSDLAFAERFGQRRAWPSPSFTDAADVEAAILGRRSIRRFTSDSVADAQIVQLLEAARWAPSAGNHQPWRFIVIREPETKAALQAAHDEALALSAHWDPAFALGGSEATPHGFLDTPAMIAVAADPARGGPHIHGELTHLIGAAHAVQNMWLMAHALGLGAVFITHVVQERAKARLGIPYELDLVGLLAVGHPAEAGNSSRRPLRAVTFEERFDRPARTR